jgi:hypothetical protein
MNRAIDSTAAEKCRVRGIHDAINMEGRNIAADDVDVHGVIVARWIGRSAVTVASGKGLLDPPSRAGIGAHSRREAFNQPCAVSL